MNGDGQASYTRRRSGLVQNPQIARAVGVNASAMNGEGR